MESKTPDTTLLDTVMTSIAKMGGVEEKRFAERVIGEINHQLLEAGLTGIQRKFALEKVRDDLEINYHEQLEEDPVFSAKSAKDKYLAIQPPYMHQLLDPEVSDELVSVWVDLMIEKKIPIPKGLPSCLGQWLVNNDSEWAELNLEPLNPKMNMIKNHDLFIRVLEKVELI